MSIVFKTLNKIQTQLITCGDPFNCNGGDVVVCITGNPGLPDFYIEFATELNKNLNLPICVIGQAGHIMVPDESSNQMKGRENLFNLEGQISHKLDLIINNIDKRSNIHLIGHSIGAWLIVELLDKNSELLGRVKSINLLFPTLQRMAETRNGFYLNQISRRLNILVILLFTALYWLPDVMRSFLVALYLKLYSLPSYYSERILKYVNPVVGEKVLFLAYDEMDRVTNLNKSGINKIKQLTNVIYSSHDDWAPLEYMSDLEQFQPEIKMKKVDIDHTFVLKSSERVADMVFEFIKEKVSK